MGDDHDGDAGPLQGPKVGQQLTPPHRVQHGRGLIQHHHLGLHRQHPGDRHPLPLPHRQQVRRPLPVSRHLHGVQRPIDPALDLPPREAQILRPEGHIFLHHRGDDLIVRYLEYHSHLGANGQSMSWIASIHPPDPHISHGGAQESVHLFGQRGLPRAVAPHQSHVLSLLDVKVDITKGHYGCCRRHLIGEPYAPHANHGIAHPHLRSQRRHTKKGPPSTARRTLAGTRISGDKSSSPAVSVQLRSKRLFVQIPVPEIRRSLWNTHRHQRSMVLGDQPPRASLSTAPKRFTPSTMFSGEG